MDRRTHDIDSVIDYVEGKSEHPYTEYPGVVSSERFYEDLNV